jgi:hypothetical protein
MGESEGVGVNSWLMMLVIGLCRDSASSCKGKLSLNSIGFLVYGIVYGIEFGINIEFVTNGSRLYNSDYERM